MAFIDQHRLVYGAEPICKVLQVAPSNYWRHSVTSNDVGSFPNLDDEGARTSVDVLDRFGATFIDEFSHPLALADCLANIDNFPRSIRFGGGPSSPDPYVYSALLFFRYGAFDKCIAVLDAALAAYDIPEPRLKWQTKRLEHVQLTRGENSEAAQLACFRASFLAITYLGGCSLASGTGPSPSSLD